MRSRDALRADQRDVLIPFLLRNPFSAAYVPMGYGKTATLLTVEVDIRALPPVGKKSHGPTLVAAPLRVAAKTWQDEVREWEHLQHLDVRFLRPDDKDPSLADAEQRGRAMERANLLAVAEKAEGARARNTSARNPSYNPVGSAGGKARTAQLEVLRRAQLLAGGDIHTIDRDRLPWLVDRFSELRYWPYSRVILDESTGFADYSTARWKAIKRVRPFLTRLHLLSGTPCPEGVEQFYGQIGLLDYGERLGRNITAFRRAYMQPKYNSRGFDPLPGAMEKACEAISDIVMVMPERERREDEEPLIHDRAFSLPPDLMERYKQFEREMVLDLPDGGEIEAETAGALCQKLLQFSSGFVYEFDKVSRRRQVHRLHEEKIEDLRQIVAECREMGTPLLLGYWYQPSLEMIRRVFPKLQVFDKVGSQMQDWTRGRIPLLALHPQGGAHGLNFQKGPGHAFTFFEVPASLELYQQFIRRLDRPGQKKRVIGFRQYARGTYEAAAMRRLKEKEDIQAFAKEYLMGLQRKRLDGNG